MKYLVQICDGNNYVDAYIILNDQTIIIQNNEMNMLIYMSELTNCVQNQNSIILFFNGNQALLFSNRAYEIKNKIDKLKQKSNNNIYQKSHKISKVEVILACFVFGAIAIYGLVESSKDMNTSYIENNQAIDNVSSNEEKNVIEEKSEKEIFLEDISKADNPYNNTIEGYEKAYDIMKNELHLRNIKYKGKDAPIVYIIEADGLSKYSKMKYFIVIDEDEVTNINTDFIINMTHKNGEVTRQNVTLYQKGKIYFTYEELVSDDFEEKYLNKMQEDYQSLMQELNE